jgi:hypothetical protein
MHTIFARELGKILGCEGDNDYFDEQDVQHQDAGGFINMQLTVIAKVRALNVRIVPL